MYAVGRIPGSFMRREGRPSEKAILSSRQIDRPMRPLFPKDLRNDVPSSAPFWRTTMTTPRRLLLCWALPSQFLSLIFRSTTL